jgi:hypothetical protein
VFLSDKIQSSAELTVTSLTYKVWYSAAPWEELAKNQLLGTNLPDVTILQRKLKFRPSLGMLHGRCDSTTKQESIIMISMTFSQWLLHFSSLKAVLKTSLLRDSYLILI